MSVDFNALFSGSAETFGAKMTETPASMTASMKETGGGSASNYEALRNKPKINGHELIGDMTPAQLGITDGRHHTHKQAQAAKVWTVAHNLGKRPAVTVVDSAGTVVIGEVDYLDDNTVRLTFCAAFSGTAYFNQGGKPVKFLTSIDLSQNEIQNAIMQPLAAPPANPKIGQIYFNSIDLTLYLWTGEKWIPVPTKTSQLENDSGFITSGDIPEGAAASTTTPKMNGTAAVGTEMAFARGDHVHPKDTSKLNTDGDGSNVTVAFEAAAKREAPVSGEKLSVLLGKVLKFFSDLKTVAFSGSYKDLSDKPTIPSAAADVGAIPATEKGAAGGVAELDSGGKVPANQLPSYVDDVVDAYIRTGVTALGANWLSKTSGGAALTPESDKIYVILSEGEYQNKTYRWSGTTYAVIGNDLAIGETASTAYRGDRGKTAYDHSQSAHAPADAEKNVQSDWNETDGNSDAFIKNKPAIPKAVTKTVQTLSDAASKSFTVTGYILSVILIDSATKEQVISDISFENATASANGKVTVTLAAAPSNPILVIITSIAL